MKTAPTPPMTRREATIPAQTRAAFEYLSSDSLSLVAEQLELGLILYDAGGNLTFHNRAAYQLLGLAPDEMEIRFGTLRPALTGLGYTADDGSPFQDIDWPGVTRAKNRESRRDAVLGVPLGSGAMRWLNVSAEPLAPSSSHGTLVTISDVSEMREASRHQRMIGEVFRSAPQAIAIMDPDGGVIAVNSAFERITGFSESEVVGKVVAALVWHELDPSLLQAIRDAADRDGIWEGEIPSVDRNGKPYWLALTAIAVRNPQGTLEGRIAIFSDITARKLTEERAQFLANFDPLTEMPNRSMLTRLLDFALTDAGRQGQMIAVLFIDLDNFKWVNDSLGHHMGDRLLLEVARRIKDTVRASDIVARQGGDEFIVALRGLADGGDAVAIAGKLVDVLARPIVLEDHRLTVGASIGIAIYPRDGETQADLLRNADAAMYEAKRSGRSQYVFYSPVLNTQAVSFAVTATRLRHAIATGGFNLLYQPLISARDGRIVALEALIRAKDEILGDPVTFIPVAERTGLIAELGEWVLVEACGQLRRWIDAGHHPPRIAINVSPTQLRDQVLIRTLKEACIFARLPPHFLEIELTETTLMEQIDEAREALVWLREQGIKVAVDDFGTGYSSLAYLERLPIDRLKIDRSFVSEIGVEGRGKIASAIINLAKGLSLEVVAEGVETERQAQWLTDMHCDYLQGYWFGKPISAREIEKLFTDTPERLRPAHQD